MTFRYYGRVAGPRVGTALPLDASRRCGAEKQDQTAEKQQQEHQEMSIESGSPDLESQTKESDDNSEEIEIQDQKSSDIKKILKIIWEI